MVALGTVGRKSADLWQKCRDVRRNAGDVWRCVGGMLDFLALLHVFWLMFGVFTLFVVFAWLGCFFLCLGVLGVFQRCLAFWVIFGVFWLFWRFGILSLLFVVVSCMVPSRNSPRVIKTPRRKSPRHPFQLFFCFFSSRRVVSCRAVLYWSCSEVKCRAVQCSVV